MTILVRCSADTARRLGALPAKMEGPVVRIPADCVALDAGTIGVWIWPLDPELARLYRG